MECAMILLRVLGLGGLMIGLLGALLMIGEGDMAYVPSAISVAIAGVLFLGFDRVITLLTQIRDGVAPQLVETSGKGVVEPPAPLGWTPRTSEELQYAIDRMNGQRIEPEDAGKPPQP
jgi:flagellar biosynthesis protein FliQ